MSNASIISIISRLEKKRAAPAQCFGGSVVATTTSSTMTGKRNSAASPRLISPEDRKAYDDRLQDILDNRWFGRITNQECGKLLAELTGDFYEAIYILNETEGPHD